MELALLSLLGAGLFFGFWQMLAISGLVSKFVLPSPGEVLIAAMRASPYRDTDIEPRRARMPVRGVSL